MRSVRVIILASAVVCAMAAMWMMRSALESRANVPSQEFARTVAPTEPEQLEPMTVDILVASRDLPIGRKLQATDVRWQPWPVDSMSDQFFSRANDPSAIDNMIGVASRLPIAEFEPITQTKVVDINSAGLLSAIMRNGMRAVAVPLSEVTGAGGFIMPGDFVDVLLTRQIEIEEINSKTGAVERVSTHHQTDTILETVRVLAVDQALVGDGEAASIANSATLELTPEQSELIPLTRQLAQQDRGFITLSLRSFAEMVEIYGDELDSVMPKTVLDLREISAKRIAAAQAQRDSYDAYVAQQREEARVELEALGVDTDNTATAGIVAEPPKPADEPSQIVLVRNGVPISLSTSNRSNTAAGGAQQ